MPEIEPPSKPAFWLDVLLTVWILVVGVVYFGGYFAPAIGALTPNASAFYALMVLISVLTLALRHLRRSETDTRNEDTRTKKRK